MVIKLYELAGKYPTEGQDLYYSRIRIQGLKWNYKRVRRVYRLLCLTKRYKTRKRIPARVKVPLRQPEYWGDIWSMDFMNDVLTSSRKFRTLNIMDGDITRAIVKPLEMPITETKVENVSNA